MVPISGAGLQGTPVSATEGEEVKLDKFDIVFSEYIRKRMVCCLGYVVV